MAGEDEAGGTVVPAEGGGAPVADTPPVVEPTAETPDPVQEAAPSSHDEPTLLEGVKAEGKENPTEGEKPAEEPKAEEAKPAEEVKAEAPKPGEVAKPEGETPAVESEPAVTFEKFAVPEDFSVDDARMAEFTELLGKPRTQETAQAIVDFGLDQMRMYAEVLNKAQHDTWTSTRKGWRDAVMADPEFGGAGFETSMARIGRMRDLFVTEGDRQAFTDFLRVTGAGDHPAFLRLMYRVGQKFDEGQQAPAPANPAPDRGRGGRGRLAAMYDNPRSQ